MGGGRIFLKIPCDTSFNKDLSNEPSFGKIHLAGQQGSTYWKIPPPLPGGGGDKYDLRGKKYQKNNERANKKRRKRKKGKGKRKEK